MNQSWVTPRALAATAGVSTDSLRHYERLGLLPGTSRTAAGYRRYPAASLDRVRLIRRALAMGFSLKELASVLRQRESGSPPCGRVRALVGERLAALEVRLKELAALRAEMRQILREWDARLERTPDGERARLLDMLADRPRLDPRVGAKRPGGRRALDAGVASPPRRSRRSSASTDDAAR